MLKNKRSILIALSLLFVVIFGVFGYIFFVKGNNLEANCGEFSDINGEKLNCDYQQSSKNDNADDNTEMFIVKIIGYKSENSTFYFEVRRKDKNSNRWLKEYFPIGHPTTKSVALFFQNSDKLFPDSSEIYSHEIVISDDMGGLKKLQELIGKEAKLFMLEIGGKKYVTTVYLKI